MKKNLTELVFILDKSGSMCGLEKDTIGGYNSMLEKQKNLPGECIVTTVLFNHQVTLLHDRVDIRSIDCITDKDYYTDGSTALLDAIGEAIHKIGNVQKHIKKDFRAEKVMFVIITDGEENSSNKYSAGKIKKMIERQKNKYKWEFIFLGANIDAVKTAKCYGIDKNRAVDYVPDEKGTALNFKMMCQAVEEYRCEGDISDDCFEEIRLDMKKRGGRR